MDRIEQDPPAEMQRRLRQRLLMAGGLIVILLGALALFEHLARMESEAPAPPPALPGPPALGPSITTGRPAEATTLDTPITPAPDLAPKDTSAVEPPPKPEIAAEPAVTPTPAPAAPVPAARPSPLPAAPAAPVSAAKPVAAIPPAPVSPPVRPEPVPVATPEGSAGTPMLAAPALPAKTAPAPPAGAPPTAPPSPPRPLSSRLAAGFVLQAGVFTSTERAEELKARLLMAGVPVTIETRVQVGPFATQKEADEARRKIRALGIDSILIPPRVGRR